jgi:glycosyltransferase involved in cell wall biosynthesis
LAFSSHKHQKMLSKSKTILHISFDYPDGHSIYKPKAVQNLVTNVEKHHHIIISLNRAGSPLHENISAKGNLIIVNCFYLKYGVLLNFFLKRAARNIISFIEKNQYQFDLIHSHKITFEGVIGHQLSQHFNKRHLITIRGDTDLKVINVKIMSRGAYKNILDHCSKLLSVTPWVVPKIQAIFKKEYDITVLPNVTFIEKANKESSLTESNSFVTAMVFERNNHIRKNLSRTLLAFKRIIAEYPFLKFKIIGDGSQRNKIMGLIDKYKLHHNIEMPGFQSHDQIIQSFRESIAFVMPSYPETFGLVYLEALSAGIPIIHSKNAGVDGYFNSSISLKVDHKSVEDIYNAIKELYLNQKQYKVNVATFINTKEFAQFQTPNILNRYYQIVESLESEMVDNKNDRFL